MSKFAGVLALALLLFVPTSASAQRVDRAPTPELDPIGVNITPRPCAYEGDDKIEKRFYKKEGWKVGLSPEVDGVFYFHLGPSDESWRSPLLQRPCPAVFVGTQKAKEAHKKTRKAFVLLVLFCG